MDIYEIEDSLVVRVEIAGMDENDFNIELKNRQLWITGSRQEAPERRAYHRMEIRFGEFSIAIDLPASIETDQVQAQYDDGFLKVIMPKIQPRQIQISSQTENSS